MFVNYSNHASGKWPEKQRREAQKYGEIVDVPFPDIPVSATTEEVEVIADKEFQRIQEVIGTEESAVVLCQGEFTLAYHIISLCRRHRIPAVCAVSQRVVHEMNEGDVVHKSVEFRFQGFRRYFTF